MGCPIFLRSFIILCKGAHTKEKAYKLLFLGYLSCKDALSTGYEL
jgi:hypothetical protein